MKTLKKSLRYRWLALCILGAPLPTLAGPQENLAANQPQTLTVERISAEPDHPLSPADLRWSPDGSHLAWMYAEPPRSLVAAAEPVRALWTVPAKGGKPQVLVAPAAIIDALRGSTTPLPPKINDEDDSNPWVLQDFAWSRDSASLYLFGNRSIARLDLATGQSKLILSGKDRITGAGLSPDGRFLSFIRNRSLFLLPATGGEARAIAASSDPSILEGEPDWSYRKLFHVEQSYAWAPDSSAIAWLETDDRAVASRTIHLVDGASRTIAWPEPGGAIPRVRLFVQALRAGKTVEVRAGGLENRYLPRFQWLPDSRHIAVERLERSQQKLELYEADARTGESRVLLTETDPYWINLNDGLHFLEDGGFLWLSERDGFRHLYRYSRDGKQIAQLTEGKWEITSLDAVDEKSGTIYVTATKASALERQLYAVRLNGKEPMRQITQRAGTHAVAFDPDGRHFADLYSNRGAQPRLTLLDASADQAADSAGEALPSEKPLPKLLPVELAPFTLHMGQQTASLMIKPRDFDAVKKYPVILYLAGGPGEQLVRDAWDGARGLWMQSMAEQGYVIFAIDNQGTAGRGHLFEEPVHLRLGAQEMVDQRDAVNYLRSLPYIDGQRIGVCGWGYGGFLAVHAMLDRPVTFKAGFAGAPTVDWRGSNAVFAEKYLEDIKVRFHSWESSAAVTADSGKFFKGKLMVAQGTEDEWVPLDQLFRLQGAMVDRGKSVETLLLPERGHAIEDLPARKLLWSRMTEFFLKNL